MTESRNHHYIPQGYLRGFGWKRGKHHMVIVHDFNDKKTFEANTRNVCAQRDFMRFEVDDRAPDWLETEIGKLESRAVASIREVVASKVFAGENKNYVLNLMALLAVRSPEQRENMREFQGRVVQRMMDLVLSKKEHWESQMSAMQDDTGKSSKVTYEEAKDFHRRGEYRIEVPRERHIQTEIGLHHTALQLLGQRRWSLYIVPGDYGEFVTTNRPVVVAYIRPEKVPLWLRHSPGFGLKDTEVYFPLTSHALLIGRWNGSEKTVSPSSQEFIGVMNKQMIEHSNGLVMSSSRSVLYHDPLMRLRWDNQVIDKFTIPPSAEEIAEFKACHGILDTLQADPED
jgi:hypothetical protein